MKKILILCLCLFAAAPVQAWNFSRVDEGGSPLRDRMDGDSSGSKAYTPGFFAGVDSGQVAVGEAMDDRTGGGKYVPGPMGNVDASAESVRERMDEDTTGSGTYVPGQYVAKYGLADENAELVGSRMDARGEGGSYTPGAFQQADNDKTLVGDAMDDQSGMGRLGR